MQSNHRVTTRRIEGPGSDDEDDRSEIAEPEARRGWADRSGKGGRFDLAETEISGRRRDCHEVPRDAQFTGLSESLTRERHVAAGLGRFVLELLELKVGTHELARHELEGRLDFNVTAVPDTKDEIAGCGQQTDQRDQNGGASCSM